MLSPSSSVFSKLGSFSTTLGVQKKGCMCTKSKKKAKHIFCIVNDMQTCYPTQHYGSEGDCPAMHEERDAAGSHDSRDEDDVFVEDDDAESSPSMAQEHPNPHIDNRNPDLEGLPHACTNSHTTTPTCPAATPVDVETSCAHRQKMHTFVNNMENKIRLGDCHARWQMQRALPLQCYVDIYPRIFNVSGGSCINSMHLEPTEHRHPRKSHKHSQCHLGTKKATCVHLGVLPDITILLHQCMMPTKQYEDDLIILIRSCIPFFQNPRRVKHDHAWPEHNDRTLCMLLKWCMPSMLSLYPQVCVKDVNFEVRVGVMRLFRELLVGSFEARNKFYLRHKTLVKMCLMEYIYYVIQNVNALPETKYIKSININVMGTNVFNIGQQFRVELNLEFAKTDKCISTEAILRLLDELAPKCHIMFERCCRYNKNSLHCGYSEMYNTSVTASNATTRLKKTDNEHTPLCMEALGSVPHTRFFSVFEMYCQRKHFASTHINVLWDHMQLIQVYEVSVELIQQQTRALRASWDCNKIQMHRQSTLLVCMLCANKNVFPTFRHDVRNNKYMCNRCNIANSVFEIDLIGRIVVVCNVPLVFSLCCHKIVLLTGRGTELNSPHPTAKLCQQSHATQLPMGVHADTGCKNGGSSCACIAWDKHTTSLNFSQVLASISISQHIARHEPSVPRRWDTASREYMQLRIEGSTALIRVSPQTRLICCMCRINAVQNKYTLLDMYNKALVIVTVCSKHSLPAHMSHTVQTVSGYLEYISTRVQR